MNFELLRRAIAALEKQAATPIPPPPPPPPSQDPSMAVGGAPVEGPQIDPQALMAAMSGAGQPPMPPGMGSGQMMAAPPMDPQMGASPGQMMAPVQQAPPLDVDMLRQIIRQVIEEMRSESSGSGDGDGDEQTQAQQLAALSRRVDSLSQLVAELANSGQGQATETDMSEGIADPETAKLVAGPETVISGHAPDSDSTSSVEHRPSALVQALRGTRASV